jgi:hypothetical protein
MNSIDVVNVFNDKLNEFVSELINITDDPDLMAFKTSLRVISALDSKKPIRLFTSHLEKNKEYSHEILNRNENFFLNSETIVSEAESLDFLNTLMIGKIKDQWATFGEQNKDVVWKYMKLLVMLGKKFITISKG